MESSIQLTEKQLEELNIATPYRVIGPLLYLKRIDYESCHWFGSLLVVAPEDQSEFTTRVQSETFDESFEAYALEKHFNYNFWRVDIRVPMHQSQSTKFDYSVSVVPDKRFTFHVPAVEAQCHWSFHSCNGFSQSVTQDERKELGGIQALWSDMLIKHKQDPLHLLVGGGDQVYADPVWGLKSLKEWLATRGKTNRREAPWTQQMEQEVSQFYFQLYCDHFYQQVICDVFAAIPQLNMADDHDFFDGCGSYPEYLEQSNIMINMKRIANNFYHLFQMCTTPQLAEQDGHIGASNNNYSIIREVGYNQAILMLDTRSERTQSQIVSEESYQQVFETLNALPARVNQLVVVVGVPIVYPRLEVYFNVLKGAAKVKKAATGSFNFVQRKVVGKTIGAVFGKGVEESLERSSQQFKKSVGKHGMLKKVVNQFGEAELADDLNDHWTCAEHNDERATFIHTMQVISKLKQMRISFIAGDVHCCSVGRLVNPQNELDCNLMYQIVSSAICNIPPPPAVIKGTNSSGQKVLYLDKSTQEEMLDIFQKDVDGTDLPEKQRKILGRRNYCLVKTVEGGALEFSLQVEAANYRLPSVAYPVVVPAFPQL